MIKQWYDSRLTTQDGVAGHDGGALVQTLLEVLDKGVALNATEFL